MGKFISVFGAAACIMMPVAARADVTAIYRTPTGIISLEYKTGGAMRLSFDLRTYLLLSYHRLYLSETSGKDARVTDLTQLAREIAPSRQAVPSTDDRHLVLLAAPENPSSRIDASRETRAELRSAINLLERTMADHAALTGPDFTGGTVLEFQWLKALRSEIGATPSAELVALSGAEVPRERFSVTQLPRDTGKYAEHMRARLRHGRNHLHD